MPNCKRHRTSPHGRGPMNCWCRCISCTAAVTRKQDTHMEMITVFIAAGRGSWFAATGTFRTHSEAGRAVRLLGTSPITTVDGRPGSVATKWSSVWNTEYRRDPFRSHLLAARAHGVPTHCTFGGRARGGTQAQHPSRQSFDTTRRIRLNRTGSHLGSTLKPGRAVLTLGVSRRSRSVACIHEDASPSEVHTQSWWHSNRGEST